MENPALPRFFPTTEEYKHLEPVSISRFGTLASCLSKFQLRYRLKERPTSEAYYFFVGHTIHKSIEDYYGGKFKTVLDAALWQLREAFKAAEAEDKWELTLKAAEIEAELLDRFAKGEYLNPKGEKYSNPRMTKIYKEKAAASGLYRMQAALNDVKLGKMDPGSEGLGGVVTRILMLAERYDKTLLRKREDFAWASTEKGFDFIAITPSGKPMRFLGFLDLHGKLKLVDKDGVEYLLSDYKTGKAHKDEEHQLAAHQSLQLTLYWFVLTQLWGIPADKLKVALHYVDAGFEAITTRSLQDWDRLLELADKYDEVSETPNLCKRLFYDGGDCERCELREACIRHFGESTQAAWNFLNPAASDEEASSEGKEVSEHDTY